MADLDTPKRIHLVGAGGAGMSALAKLLSQKGHSVSGSDLKAGPALLGLADLGITVWEGSRPAAIEGVDIVVASSAVPDRDAEVNAAHQAGITVWHRPDLLAALTRETPALAATGTHGKTSSTAMMVAALRATGADPSFVVGGTLGGFGTNAHLGDPDLFVLEADEAFGTFLSLALGGLMLTNVEAEHLEYYRSLAEIEDAFTSVARATDGPVVACFDDPGSRRIALRTGAVGYGTNPEAAWRVSSVDLGASSVSFDLMHRGSSLPVTVPQPGLHTALNAAGVLALLGELGYNLADATRGIASYRGVHRRFERRGTVAGVTIIDDYAHHPTEVMATIRAALAGEWRSVWAVFQPHLYSRTERLHREFGAAFAGVDHVVVTDVYGAREVPVPGITGRLVADAAEARTQSSVHYVPHRSDVARYVAARVGPGDLVLTMGAGDITLLADELTRELTGDEP